MEGFPSESHKEIFSLLSMQPSDPDSCNNDVVLADPLDSSRVSGSTSEVDFQSLLLIEDVVERYLVGVHFGNKIIISNIGFQINFLKIIQNTQRGSEN
jgi:hypothetical protein